MGGNWKETTTPNYVNIKITVTFYQFMETNKRKKKKQIKEKKSK